LSGGYYDRTFSNLTNNQHEFIPIVVAFKDQRVKEVIHDEYDQKINYILTEKKLYKII
jgi:5-formyltetrahydrofolate cyclo-ligase